MSPSGTTFTAAVPVSLMEQFQWIQKLYSCCGRVAEALGERVAGMHEHDAPERIDLCIKLYALNGMVQRLGALCHLAEHEYRAVQTGLVRQLIEYAALGYSTQPLDISRPGSDPSISEPVFVHRKSRKPIKKYGVPFIARSLPGNDARLRKFVVQIYKDTSGFIHPSVREFITCIRKENGLDAAQPRGIEGYADLLMSIVGGLCIEIDKKHSLDVFSDDELADWLREAAVRYERRNTGGQ